MDKTINCEECKNQFTYAVPTKYPDRRKYCDVCSVKRKEAWNAGNQAPQTEPVNAEVVKVEYKTPGYPKDITAKKVKEENGEYQSTVYNRTVAPNSYEVGSAGNRFKLYFETAQDLKDKMQELRDAGLMDMPETLHVMGE